MAGSHEALSSRDEQRVALESWVLLLSAARYRKRARDPRRLLDSPDAWIAFTWLKLDITPRGKR